LGGSGDRGRTDRPRCPAGAPDGRRSPLRRTSFQVCNIGRSDLSRDNTRHRIIETARDCC
jgi:hypothetical protein